MKKILIVGAGLSGAVVANQLACAGFDIDVIDSRNHIAGNCYNERDPTTNVMVHSYGPHIFHTDNSDVWCYVNSFADFVPYVLRVKATIDRGVFSLPINLHTINQFFNKTFNPSEARDFISSLGNQHINVHSFKDQAERFLGVDIYEAFFHHYPMKQWGIDPSQIPASVLKRLPVRFDYDDNYFAHKYQGIPRRGYAAMVEQMLNSNRINVRLNTKFDASMRENYSHVFYSGKLDSWFDYRYGDLHYRTLRFETSNHVGNYQGCAVMSYPGENESYTRIVEHKHFAPWESHDSTTIHKEFSALATRDDVPYYPIRMVKDQPSLAKYVELANTEQNVTFIGRLGTYRYLDMDVTIAEALSCADIFIESRMNSTKMSSFTHT